MLFENKTSRGTFAGLSRGENSLCVTWTIFVPIFVPVTEFCPYVMKCSDVFWKPKKKHETRSG